MTQNNTDTHKTDHNTLLTLDGISIRYGRHLVIDNISMHLERGEIGCLLGSSGCGKTSLLRCIAGFEQANQGQIVINNTTISHRTTHIPPERRHIGMVFQDFALFPHLTIKDNIAFGLLTLTKKEKKCRVDELLMLINLHDSANKYPHQLSGGQQQRVALARALAPKPDLLLLDEPFSSLDIELREQLASEVRKIIKHEGITAILVTHDQHEAFATADKIGLLHDGKMIQWDSPYHLYHQPKTPYVAHFIGQGVLIPGSIVDQSTIKTSLGLISWQVPQDFKSNEHIQILLRPENIIQSKQSKYQLKIIDKVFRGAEFLYTLELSDGHHVLYVSSSQNNYDIQSHIGIELKVNKAIVFY